VGVLCLSTAPALAAVAHQPLFQLAEVPTEGPHGELVALPGELGNLESMAVDSGHLWVAEGQYLRGGSRVDEFDAATGAFIAQPIHLPAPTEAERNLPTGFGSVYGEGVAVGHGSGEAAVYVGGEQHGVSVVSVFNEAGALKGTWNGAGTPSGTFGTIDEGGGRELGTVTSIAADNSTSPLDPGRGDVFVALGSRDVIDVFHPEADGEERYVGQVAGVSPSEPFSSPRHIAVNEVNGDLLVLDNETIDVFEPTGLGSYAFARKLAGPPPNDIFHSPYTFNVDGGTGDVFVTEFPQGAPYRMVQFSAAGAYLGQIESIPDAYAVAVDPESHDLYLRNMVYGPDIVIPDVATDPPSDLRPESVTLMGTVNPDGAGVAKCQFEWGTTPSLGKVVPCVEEVANGESPVPVQAQLAGLERDTTYYYRLQASDQNGTNVGEPRQTQSFTTLGVILRAESVADVTATAATLEATIDPDKQPTSYYFQYGLSTAYGHDAPALPGEAIGSGATDVQVPPLHVQGLSPETTYHYRVVVVSELHPGEPETVEGEDHTFTTQPASSSFSLLDGRQWELVSPPNKLGALIYPLGGYGAMQASASGDAIAYRANSPTEGEPPGYAHTETVLSTRGAGGWSTQDISVPHDQEAGGLASTGVEFRLFSTDLSGAIVVPASSEFTPLSPEASESTSYLRTDFLAGNVEDRCDSSCYRPLVTGKAGYANVPPGTVFGEEPTGDCPGATCGPRFEGGTRDLSHVILSSAAQLTATPASAGVPGVYEWSAGRLQLVGVLPEGEEGPAILAGSYTHEATGVRNAISDDGERVILEGGEVGGTGLYLRNVAAEETTRLDLPQGGTGPSQGLHYTTASSDAARVFFLDSGHLTASSSASGEDLYEYDLSAPAGSRLTDLTADENPGEAAGVKAVIGASEDGASVYFVASGALAAGAKANGLNLYVRRAGTTKLVGVLDQADERLYNEGSRIFGRVSPDGQWLAFMSSADLTGYDTHDAVNGQSDAEVYLYHAPASDLVCASCNPTGARPVGKFFPYGVEAAGSGLGETQVASNVPPWSTVEALTGPVGTFYQSRYLSDSGRLFFDSSDALVPQDVNGTEDVYEYEPTGIGSCESSSATFLSRSKGCLSLVSSGTSSEESAFLDASETGGDVFFLTASQLVGQDYDTADDIYDAQECARSSPCPPASVPQPPACTTEASCKAAPTPQPSLYGAPASSTFSGTGNVASEAAPAVGAKSKPKERHKTRCAKHRAKRGCAKTKKSQRARRSRKAPAKARRGGKR
jgi:hypothetical protein